MGALLRACLQIPARFAYLQSSGEPALHCSLRCRQAASCPTSPLFCPLSRLGVVSQEIARQRDWNIKFLVKPSVRSEQGLCPHSVIWVKLP